MFSIQLATPDDADEIRSFDQTARQENSRAEFIHRVVSTKCCYIAVAEEQIKGYAALEYSFFKKGFIPMLYVRLDSRRQGVGASLLNHLEKTCKTEKVFTSTNLSNQPMQSLLAKAGYTLSGIIHDLDEGHPELIYVKHLRK